MPLRNLFGRRDKGGGNDDSDDDDLTPLEYYAGVPESLQRKPPPPPPTQAPANADPTPPSSPKWPRKRSGTLSTISSRGSGHRSRLASVSNFFTRSRESSDPPAMVIKHIPQSTPHQSRTSLDKVHEVSAHQSQASLHQATHERREHGMTPPLPPNPFNQEPHHYRGDMPSVPLHHRQRNARRHSRTPSSTTSFEEYDAESDEDPFKYDDRPSATRQHREQESHTASPRRPLPSSGVREKVLTGLHGKEQSDRGRTGEQVFYPSF